MFKFINKNKFMRSYYAKLTLFSILMAFALIVTIVSIVLFSVKVERTAAAKHSYEEVLHELADEFSNIWNNYYLALYPFINYSNREALITFLNPQAMNDSPQKVYTEFERILNDACQQDSRICGLYFKRLSDQSVFLYSKNRKELKITHLTLQEDSTENYQRLLVGGRKLNFGIMKQAEWVEFFGLQSGILSASLDTDAKYQLTVLYDISSLDSITQDHNSDEGIRFMIVSQDGMVVYDSWKKYQINEETYFEELDQILTSDELIEIDHKIFLKGYKNLNRSGCIVFYYVSQSSLKNFLTSGSTSLVIIMAVIVMLGVTLVMISINRLMNRKFQELEDGMSQIGMNNLAYRIPTGKREDEFYRIATNFNTMCDELENIIEKNYLYQILQRNAEYFALQTSVNPHFLYNSLEALREKLEINEQNECAEMVLLMSRIFEYQIRGDSIVTIRREQNALLNYIDFSAIRFQYAFEYSMDFEDDVMDFMVPKQIFQPIMENYFVHGFRGDGTDIIYIKGYLDTQNDLINISFCDNGKGMSKEQIDLLNVTLTKKENDNSHIGLKNVLSRLQIAFGNNSRVVVTSNEPNTGICVTLIFPKKMVIENFDMIERNYD